MTQATVIFQGTVASRTFRLVQVDENATVLEELVSLDSMGGERWTVPVNIDTPIVALLMKAKKV